MKTSFGRVDAGVAVNGQVYLSLNRPARNNVKRTLHFVVYGNETDMRAVIAEIEQAIAGLAEQPGAAQEEIEDLRRRIAALEAR